MNTAKLRDLTLALLFLTISFILIQQYLKNDGFTNNIPKQVHPIHQSTSDLDTRLFKNVKTRDFIRYECIDLKRIGGLEQLVKNAPHNLYRLDGAWFICNDKRIAPMPQKCVVMSFGVRDDFSFDEQMNREYGCRTFSFDPFEEASFFSDFRASNNRLHNSAEISVNSNWKFYRF